MKIAEIAKEIKVIAEDAGCHTGWVVLYKVGRSWGVANTINFDTDEYTSWCKQQKLSLIEFLEILEKDPNAIIVDAFTLNLGENSIKHLAHRLVELYYSDDTNIKLSTRQELINAELGALCLHDDVPQSKAEEQETQSNTIQRNPTQSNTTQHYPTLPNAIQHNPTQPNAGEPKVVKFQIGGVYGAGLPSTNITEITSCSNYDGIVKYGYNVYELDGVCLRKIYSGLEVVSVCRADACETISVKTDYGIYICRATETLPRQIIAPFKPMFIIGEKYKINDNIYVMIEDIKSLIDVGTVIYYKVYEKKDDYYTNVTRHTQKPAYNIQCGSWVLDIAMQGKNYTVKTADGTKGGV